MTRHWPLPQPPLPLPHMPHGRQATGKKTFMYPPTNVEINNKGWLASWLWPRHHLLSSQFPDRIAPTRSAPNRGLFTQQLSRLGQSDSGTDGQITACYILIEVPDHRGWTTECMSCNVYESFRVYLAKNYCIIWSISCISLGRWLCMESELVSCQL